ncbi:hypothetical protein TNCV_587131 [Trichonephila clavipes]|nr:hypothetical protein TNCV_587131 [Trichonephila clavipes]
MWSMVAQRLTQITPPAATPDQLWQSVKAAWFAVPQEHIQSLFESIPRQTGRVDGVERVSPRVGTSQAVYHKARSTKGLRVSNREELHVMTKDRAAHQRQPLRTMCK